jgi:hypothetical protein
MRYPGREFGAEKPKVMYVALRWNASRPKSDQEMKMITRVAERLGVQPKELRIYNLVRPSKGRGMSLRINEFDDVAQTIQRIQFRAGRSNTMERIVVGGRSGPMPLVALLLKFLLPRIEVEVRKHHAARRGQALKFPKKIKL